MIALASTPPTAPGFTQTWIPSIAAALVSLIVGYLVYRNARRANAITERSDLAKSQLEWTRQAMTEAQAAKSEARTATETASEAERAARAATRAAESATRRAEVAESRLTDVQELAGKLVDWIARVVRKAHEVEAGEATDPHVRELLRVINGGPPEVSSSQIRKRGQ